MLSRIALRAARARPIRPIYPNLLSPTVSTGLHIRYYAKDNRPHRPPRKSSAFNGEPNISAAAEVYSKESKAEHSATDAKKFIESRDSSLGSSSSQRTEAHVREDSQRYDKDTIVDSIGGHEASENNTSHAGGNGTSTNPLPDLRHGIPSTFAAEFGKTQFDARRSSPQEPHDHNITEDPAKPNPPPGSGGRGSGELPKSAYETSTDRRRNQYMNWTGLAFALFGVAGAAYYGRNWDSVEEENAHSDAPSGWNLGDMWKRINARWSSQLSYYTEPTFPKLLPDMDVAPYTLVLSLNDLLIHSEWTREHGWRTAKRPGLDYFLRYLSQYYEIVVFTDLPSTSADPIIKKLDPLRMTIMWPLFREATRYENGEYIKDLSYLNRDLSKVILVDTKHSHAKLQPNNSIVLSPWDGKPNDKGLVNLIPFLEYLAAMGIPDVRAAIKSFEGKDIPTEFARREAIAREQFNKQLSEERAKRPKRSGSTWLMGALGMKPQGAVTVDGVSLAEGFEQGKMLSDQARERGQKQYEMMDKEIRENGEKWLKELEAEERKAQEEWMKGMKSSMSVKGLFGGEQQSAQAFEEKR